MTSEAQSPFRPGTHEQTAWDSTSIKLFKECPRKYYYKMIEGWKRGKEINPHLFFGGEFAHALEKFTQRRISGMSHDEALRVTVREALERSWFESEEGEPGPWVSIDEYKTRDHLIRSIIWYVDYWKDDPAEVFVLANGEPAVELSFRFNATDDILLCGHLDKVVKYNGDIYVMDQKTSKSTITPRFFQGFNPDDQMSMYTLAGKIIFDIPVSGVLIDAAQIAKGFTRFTRGVTMRQTAQLDEWLEGVLAAIERAHTCARTGYWPMNETACNNYAGCEFRDVCSASPKVRKALLKGNFIKKFWNPLEVR